MKRDLQLYSRVAAALLFVLLSLSACQMDIKKYTEEKKKEEETAAGGTEVKTTYWDGTQTVRSRVQYLNGKKEGLAEQFYRNGNKQMEIAYSNGEKEGMTRVFYEDGKLYRETPYVNGLIEGVQKIYHPNGIVAAEIPYREDWPGIGLKEYDTKGNEITEEYSIDFEHVNMLKKKNLYRVYINFNPGSSSSEFWFGQPVDGIYIDPEDHVAIAKEKGRYFLEFEVEPGYRLVKDVHIIGERKSNYKNPYVAKATLSLDIVNPG